MPTTFDLPWDIAIRLLFAAVLGGIIGYERGETGAPAGLRTNMIIAISACVFTLVASIQFAPKDGSGNPIIGHIIAGVGFLGAGVVMQSNGKRIGLTTAATTWLVAALGMAAGAGAYFLGLFGAIICYIILHYLEPLSEHLDHVAHLRLEQKTARMMKQRQEIAGKTLKKRVR